MPAYFILASLLLGVAMAGYAPYTDLAQLYRYQLLANAFDDLNQDGGMPLTDDVGDIDIRSYWPELAATLEDRDIKSLDDPSIYDSQIYSGAQLRDQEHIEHSALHGYQSVSGGTAEGSTNSKITKTDKPLPAYCNPPNPCPIGKTAKDNCVEDFDNSAENNKKLLSEQDCPCDTEHMFSCAGKETVSSKGQAGYQQTLNKVIDQLSKMGDGNEETDSLVNEAKKRITLVAKKSPHIIHKRSEIAETNPYLQGSRMDRAAKKNHEMAQNSLNNLAEEWLEQHFGQN